MRLGSPEARTELSALQSTVLDLFPTALEGWIAVAVLLHKPEAHRRVVMVRKQDLYLSIMQDMVFMKMKHIHNLQIQV